MVMPLKPVSVSASSGTRPRAVPRMLRSGWDSINSERLGDWARTEATNAARVNMVFMLSTGRAAVAAVAEGVWGWGWGWGGSCKVLAISLPLSAWTTSYSHNRRGYVADINRHIQATKRKYLELVSLRGFRGLHFASRSEKPQCICHDSYSIDCQKASPRSFVRVRVLRAHNCCSV